MIYLETSHSDQHYFFLFFMLYTLSIALQLRCLTAGFICVEKCHLAQAASTLSESEGGGGGLATGEEFICVGAASIC